MKKVIVWLLTLLMVFSLFGCGRDAASLPLPGDPVAFPMDNTEDAASLVEAVNAALEEMRADGSLAELCIQFMGEDLTQEIPAE